MFPLSALSSTRLPAAVLGGILACLLLAAVAVADPPAQPADAAARIAALRAEIAYHDTLYYEKAAPEISDAAYDRLKQTLRELERAHPAAADAAGAALPLFGDDRNGDFASVPHGAPMLSLDKAYALADLEAFDRRITAATGGEPVRYRVEPKFDGLAISLIYENGRFTRALSRGDGRAGADLTSRVRTIPGFPESLVATGFAPPARVELRGELYLQWDAFRRLNAAREADGEAPYATPRNLAVGTVRAEDPALVVERGLALVLFGWGEWIPAAEAPPSFGAFREVLEAWDLPVAHPVLLVEGSVGLSQAVERFRALRPGLPYPTDGLVAKVEGTALRTRLGLGPEAPRWAIAYKYLAEQAETRLLGITPQVGRTGRITPVAELSPVTLGGTVVARASLHHPGEIERLDLRPGDTVVIEKVGDVIPALVAVRHDLRPPGLAPYAFPATCPACDRPLETSARGAVFRCPFTDCPAQQQRRLEHFARVLDLNGLGPQTLESLRLGDTLTSPADLYRLPPGAVSPSIEEAIQRSRGSSLAKLLEALGIPGLGPVRAAQLAEVGRDPAALLEARAEDLAGAVPESTAEAFLHWRAQPGHAELLAALAAAGLGHPAPPDSGENNAFSLAGTTLVLTGRLDLGPRAAVVRRIEAAGGTVRDRVTRETDYLVRGENPGTKLDRAIELGIPVIDEATLRALLGED